MTVFWQDVQYGLRMLRKNRGFTAIAILTLALGIGANTALFSVVNGVLLNPLPYPHADRLVAIYQKTRQFAKGSVGYLNFIDWCNDNRTFDSMTAFRHDNFNLTGRGDAERVTGEMVSASFFPILGVQPAIGRTFSPGEDRLGAPPVVLVSDGLWRRKFAASRDIVGTAITLNGIPHTVIGVLPSTYKLDRYQDLYVPIGQWSDPTFRDRRVSMGMNVIGRLAPGVSFEQARGDMERIASNLSSTYPEADMGKSVTLVPLKQDIIGDIKPYLILLFGAVAFVLLIACANVANLLLARSTGRTHEFAVRTAMGAGRARIIRQLLTESVMLAVIGGGIGLLFAAWGTKSVMASLPAALPRGEEIHLDLRVFVFTLLISLLAGVLFGLAPAFKISHTRVQET